MDDTIKRISQIETEYSAKAKAIQRTSQEMSSAISGAVQQAASEIAFALGDSLGDAISGAGGGLKNLGSSIYKILGDLLTNIGKALITYSSVIQGLKKAIEGMDGWVAIAAGVLAVAAGKALKNQASKAGGSVTRFAKGGFAFGEMSAIVGDNPNARFDPEMIAPYSKVDQSIKKSIAETNRYGGASGYIASTSISGRELLILIEREQTSRKGLTGI